MLAIECTEFSRAMIWPSTVTETPSDTTGKLGSVAPAILRSLSYQKATIAAYALVHACGGAHRSQIPLSSQINPVPAELRRNGRRIEEPRQSSVVGCIKRGMGKVANLW